MKKIVTIVLSLAIIAGLNAQEKEQPPSGGEPKDFVLPNKEVMTLENGLELVLVPYGAIPKANISVVVKTGNIHETEDEVWLCDLVADLLEEGSTSLDAKAIADKMASMGGNLNVGVEAHTTSLGSSVLYEFRTGRHSCHCRCSQKPSVAGSGNRSAQK